jgi:hypothetical protein
MFGNPNTTTDCSNDGSGITDSNAFNVIYNFGTNDAGKYRTKRDYLISSADPPTGATCGETYNYNGVTDKVSECAIEDDTAPTGASGFANGYRLLTNPDGSTDNSVLIVGITRSFYLLISDVNVPYNGENSKIKAVDKFYNALNIQIAIVTQEKQTLTAEKTELTTIGTNLNTKLDTLGGAYNSIVDKFGWLYKIGTCGT